MKKKYGFIVLVACFINIIFCEDINEKFNYYIRNFDGSYELKNIESPDNIKIDLFSYEYKKEVSVTGFYYKSKRIKFIDTLLNKKISKTVYYDYNTGKPIFKKTYNYTEDGILRTIEVEHINDQKIQNKYFIKFIFIENKKGLFDYYAYRYSKWNSGVSRYSFSKGVFDKNFRPLNIISENIECVGSVMEAQKFIERFDYREDGYNYYIYLKNIKTPIFIKTETKKGNNIYTNITSYNINGDWHDSYVLKNFKDREIAILQDFDQKPYIKETKKIIFEKNLKVLIPVEPSQEYDFIFSSEDEEVYFKDNKIIDSVLILYFDIYHKNFLHDFPIFSDKQFISRKK